MKKQFTRLLSILLTLVMAVQLMPAMAPVRAADATDDYDCDVGLLGPFGEVYPFLNKKNWNSNFDGNVTINGWSDPQHVSTTNVWVYYLDKGGIYEMNTDGTCTAAVTLIVNTADPITLVLDGVSFDVATSPERPNKLATYGGQGTNNYPGVIEVVHSGATGPDFNIQVKGTNTINASTAPADRPLRGVLSVQGVTMTISGYDTSGTNVLNIGYSGTAQATSGNYLAGIWQASSRSSDGTDTAFPFTFGPDVTVNLGSYGEDGTSKLAKAFGINMPGQLVLDDGADVNIHTGEGGRAMNLSNSREEETVLWVKEDAKLTMIAGKYGIYYTCGDIVFDDGSEVDITAGYRCINNRTDENNGHEALLIGDGASVDLTTTSADYEHFTVHLYDNLGAGITVGENSTVNITNSSTTSVKYPTVQVGNGNFTVGSGSVVNIGGPRMGLYLTGNTTNEYTDSGRLILEPGATLNVTTTLDYGRGKGDYGIRLGGNGMYIADGAALTVNSAGDYGISTEKSYYHDSALEINSGSVLIRAAVAAFHDISSNPEYKNPLKRGVTPAGVVCTYYSTDTCTWAEKDSVTWTQYITDAPYAAPWFKTDVMELDITLNAKSIANGCSGQVSANVSYPCDLYVAAYDEDGRMLAVKAVGSCNLMEEIDFQMTYTGTASYVKAYLLEPGGFVPKQFAIKDENLEE